MTIGDLTSHSKGKGAKRKEMARRYKETESARPRYAAMRPYQIIEDRTINEKKTPEGGGSAGNKCREAFAKGME